MLSFNLWDVPNSKPLSKFLLHSKLRVHTRLIALFIKITLFTLKGQSKRMRYRAVSLSSKKEGTSREEKFRTKVLLEMRY